MVSSPAAASRRFPIRSFRELRGNLRTFQFEFFSPLLAVVFWDVFLCPLSCAVRCSSIVPRVKSGGTVSL